jgi:hypothetical protein
MSFASLNSGSQRRLIRNARFSAALSLAVVAFGQRAKTPRWASKGDVFTMDPHSQNNGPDQRYV